MIDSHIKGPAVNGYGAIAGMRGLRTTFGVTLAGAANRRLLLQTTGASPTNPLIVELNQLFKTAFNGTAPEVEITSEDPNGANPTQEWTIADSGVGSTNSGWKTRLLTSDRKFYVKYTAATGSPTTGDGYSFARVSGLGPAI